MRHVRLVSVNKQRPFIAVVDDDPGVRKALANLLRMSALEVELFDGGAAFLASLEDRKPDCVVLDLAMPGVSGFDVLSCLAADTAAKVGVLAITARDSARWCERAPASGAPSVHWPAGQARVCTSPSMRKPSWTRSVKRSQT